MSFTPVGVHHATQHQLLENQEDAGGNFFYICCFCLYIEESMWGWISVTNLCFRVAWEVSRGPEERPGRRALGSSLNESHRCNAENLASTQHSGQSTYESKSPISVRGLSDFRPVWTRFGLAPKCSADCPILVPKCCVFGVKKGKSERAGRARIRPDFSGLAHNRTKPDSSDLDRCCGGGIVRLLRHGLSGKKSWILE